MAVSAQFSESNTSAETVTDGITNSNWGSIDSPNLSTSSGALLPGNRSYEKWQRMKFTGFTGLELVDNFRLYLSTGSFSGDDRLYTNVETANPANDTFPAGGPSTGTTYTGSNSMPESDPGAANVAGSRTTDGYSNYFVHQLMVAPGSVSGNQGFVLRFQYDETS